MKNPQNIHQFITISRKTIQFPISFIIFVDIAIKLNSQYFCVCAIWYKCHISNRTIDSIDILWKFWEFPGKVEENQIK